MADIHEALAAHLQRKLIDAATGESEDLIVDNRPKNVLFAGCLTPRPSASTDNLESAEDFYARLAPSAIQLRFLVPRAESLSISVTPGCHTYYRVIPPFWAQDRRTARSEDGSRNTEGLVRAFRKCSVVFDAIPVALVDGAPPTVIDVSNTINSALATAVSSDEDALRPRDSWAVPASALTSDEALRGWCGASAHHPCPPELTVEAQAELREWTDPLLSQVIVTLVNRSAPNDDFERADYWEATLFNTSIRVEVQTEGIAIRPYAFSALPNSYRFDRDQWGAGVNCVARVGSDHRQIVAESVATYVQPRLEHRALDGVDLSFSLLARDPIPPLLRLRERMLEYRASAWGAKARQLEVYPADHVFRTEFASDLADFDRELGELSQGITILEEPRYAILRQAFCHANEAFAKSARSDRWRLFQLVFIVRNLASLAAREWNEISGSDDVEVLWFPTGGGKTEAFLGLLTTALFFDRLRGRTSGVTGLVRLPLRLLSHQQFQRIIKTVTAAEGVRRGAKIGGKPFSVGYWIGQAGSPNTVDEATAKEWEENPSKCQRWKKIQKCPQCGGDISLRFNRALWSLAHHCENEVCGNKGDLPLYIIDDELYRFLPSIVVGTVDKLAAFGFQRRFSNLIGWPASVCPKHGFSASTVCSVPRCKEETKDASLKDPVPSLLIQDELHLLKEDLGAFDGHYETAVMGVQREIPGGRPWKIIAATATIEQYDWQAYHLYCKRARRFPCPGPSWQDTFYACTTTETNRLFLGILPFNRSHINAMISALWIYHREIRSLRKQLSSEQDAVGRALGLRDNADYATLVAVLNDYEVSLTYVLTRKAGDQMAESLATQVAGYLRDENEEPVAIRSLTGQTSTIEVEQILNEIETGGTRTELSPAPVDAVVATSMISHGVDVDRFNFIAFFGMPRMTAEYIQASSRVGRRFPGLALIVFSPARERDRSHFHLFAKYHQYLDRLVEPPAINRWAEFAVRHTLPGIFVGSIINVLGRQLKRNLYLERDLHRALHVDHVITLAELTDRVVRYYDADGEHAETLRSDVAHRIELFLNGLRPNAARTIWSASDFRPMMSLRDVEEPVYFTASQYSAAAFSLWMKRQRLTAPSGEIAIE